MLCSTNLPLSAFCVKNTRTSVDAFSAFACASLVIQMIAFTSPSPHVIQATKIPTPITPSATFVVKRELQTDSQDMNRKETFTLRLQILLSADLGCMYC